MSDLPNPFEFAGVVMPPADKAAASLPHAPAPGAAATPSDSGAITVSVPDEPATSLRQEDVAVEYVDLDQDHIGEIFVGAEKLNDPEARFVLDVHAFMDAIDEAPLFLRRFG